MSEVRRVFIGHATEADGDFAHRLADELRRHGLDVWIAPDSIRPGEEWVNAINRGLETSTYFVLVLTPDAVASPWVQLEMNTAIRRERQGEMTIIQLEVRSCRPPMLWQSYQLIPYGDARAGLTRLLGVLGVPPGPPARQPFEPEMVLIPAGQFLMGSDPQKDRYAQGNEQPQHPLYLPDYYLAKYPVTNAQYAAFVQATSYRQPAHWKGGKPPPGKEDHPVVEVSWHDAVAYCNWLAEVTGKPYRLPSEAEWEKGARGGDGRIYPWGDRWDAQRCNSAEGGPGDTTPVGAYPRGASPYGLLDMVGNVWEWTRSLYKEYPYDPEDGREDLQAGGPRVLRGGSWLDNRRSARCAYRNWGDPDPFRNYVGIRVVVAPGS
jgi:formylglycine-generating enzyme required for sulfatase activity